MPLLLYDLVLNEPDSGNARTLWAAWTAAGEELIAPVFFTAEVVSTVRRHVHFGTVPAHEGDQAFRTLMRLPVELQEPEGLYDRAWALARRFGQPTVYDCCYLALADIAGTEFWTADERFADVVRPDFPRVHVLAEAVT